MLAKWTASGLKWRVFAWRARPSWGPQSGEEPQWLLSAVPLEALSKSRDTARVKDNKVEMAVDNEGIPWSKQVGVYLEAGS